MTVINSSNNSASESIVFFKLNGEDELITRIGRSSLHAIIESRFGVLPSGPSKRMRSVALPLSSRELFAISLVDETRSHNFTFGVWSGSLRKLYYTHKKAPRTSVDKVSWSNVPSTQLLNFLLFLSLVILQCLGWNNSFI
ncbi:hypothetical protein YC2023_077553 [Brassica napus]